MKSREGMWSELACMLFAALVGGLVLAWVVGDAIWRDGMNAIVRDREAKGETFIYVMGTDGPIPWKHEPDGCGACKLAERYWATWRSEHGANQSQQQDEGNAPRTAGGSHSPSKGRGEGAEGMEGPTGPVRATGG